MKKILVVSLLAASAYLALPGSKASPAADADVYSRFNLSQRLEQNSAQYRVSEAATLATVYDDNPLVLLIGTGPGSLVTFNDGLVNEVKDLTHNVYNNIILKTGLLGAVLFVGGLLVAVRSQILNPGVLGRCLIGSMASIAVVSTTVPFVSTVMGLTALLALVTLAVWIAVDERGKRVGGNASE